SVSIPRPPISTLFPYTTLFRSCCQQENLAAIRAERQQSLVVDIIGNCKTGHKSVSVRAPVTGRRRLSADEIVDAEQILMILPGLYMIKTTGDPELGDVLDGKFIGVFGMDTLAALEMKTMIADMDRLVCHADQVHLDTGQGHIKKSIVLKLMPIKVRPQFVIDTPQ